MRRCEWSVRSPSKRTNRCLPWASTAFTSRPLRRSSQRSFEWRGCGISIDLISVPTSAAPTRCAARWMLSPSGMPEGYEAGAALVAHELSVEAERDVVRHLRACLLLERRRVEHQQERAAGRAVEDHAQDGPVVLRASFRPAHEDR